MTVSPLSPSTAPPRELRFDATVPRGLVHRAAVAEVFVTDSVQLDADRYLAAAQLPRIHGFFNDSTGDHHDLLLLTEISRQAGVLVAHRHLGVPHDRAFVLQDAEIAVTDLEATRGLRAEPSRLAVDIAVGSLQSRGDVPFRFAVDLAFSIDGAPAARGTGSMLFLAKSIYRGFRGHVRRRKGFDAPGDPAPRPVALAPEAVGRRDPRNVVIGAPAGDPRSDDGLACEVIVDRRHPCLFDHPLDHLPGMLMLEAFRQTALVAAQQGCGMPACGAVATRCRGRFAEFGEFELATHCHARIAGARRGSGPGEAVAVDVELRQGAHVLGSGAVEVTRWA